jgi:hypothetical protein
MVDGVPAVEGAAGEVRYESVDGAGKGRLADARVADDEAAFAFLDRHVDFARSARRRRAHPPANSTAAPG